MVGFSKSWVLTKVVSDSKKGQATACFGKASSTGSQISSYKLCCIQNEVLMYAAQSVFGMEGRTCLHSA